MYQKIKTWFLREMSHRFGWSADGRKWGRIVAKHKKGKK